MCAVSAVEHILIGKAVVCRLFADQVCRACSCLEGVRMES